MTDFLLDIDGTVADFTRAALRTFYWSDEAIANLYNNWPKGVYWLHDILGISKTKFFRTINAGGPVFWETLPKYSWACRLTSELRKLGKVTYCTSPGLSPVAASGKMVWLAAHGAGSDFILTSQKHLCATPNAVLIDDHADLCEKFHSRGGSAILIPQPWNGHAPCTEAYIDVVLASARLFSKGHSGHYVCGGP